MSDYQPPKNLMITPVKAEHGYYISLRGGDYTLDEAISLGLALMETGLYLKAQAKLNHQPKE